MFSAKNVANGLAGIAPVAIGIAMFSTTILFYQFRFKDFPNALMTMFYIMNGDTVFDTITGINQVSFLYTLIWTYFWIWFGNNVIMNITLAQVEDGYVDARNSETNEWLVKKLVDPEFKSSGEVIKENS